MRNIDNQIYEIVYEASNDSVRVLNKAARLEYATEVAKDNRIVLLLDQTKELPGGLPSFAQLQVGAGAGGGGRGWAGGMGWGGVGRRGCVHAEGRVCGDLS